MTPAGMKRKPRGQGASTGTSTAAAASSASTAPSLKHFRGKNSATVEAAQIPSTLHTLIYS